MEEGSKEVWDVCVIGAGIIGSATALTLAREGQETLLVEQFLLPHTRGSSHGQSRAFRYSYTQIHYTEMMPEAYRLWRELEQQSDTQLLIKTGLLNVEFSPFNAIKEIQNALEKVGASSKFMTGDEFQQNFPMLKYPVGSGGLLEHDGGVLMADKCGKCIRKLFEESSGTIRDGEEILGIIPGNPVVIRSSKRTYRSRKVVITAGPWTNKLLNPIGVDLPLKEKALHVEGNKIPEANFKCIYRFTRHLNLDTPQRVNVCYWRIHDKRYRADEGFPTWADMGSCGLDKCELYGLPCIEYPNLMKVCLHEGKHINPESRDSDDLADSEKDVQQIGDYLRNHFKGVEDKPAIIEKCMYTNTPDYDFILDHHPHHKNIIIGAGFSGHGFKLAPVVGKILSELAQGKNPSYDMTPFKISRFRNVKSAL